MDIFFCKYNVQYLWYYRKNSACLNVDQNRNNTGGKKISDTFYNSIKNQVTAIRELSMDKIGYRGWQFCISQFIIFSKNIQRWRYTHKPAKKHEKLKIRIYRHLILYKLLPYLNTCVFCSSNHLRNGNQFHSNVWQ